MYPTANKDDCIANSYIIPVYTKTLNTESIENEQCGGLRIVKTAKKEEALHLIHDNVSLLIFIRILHKSLCEGPRCSLCDDVLD